MRRIRRWSLLLVLLLPVPIAAGAQDTAAHDWTAWYGCWTPLGSAGADAPWTCVVPSAGSTAEAEFVTIRDGRELRRVSLRADGARRAIEAAGCSGWESASFSVDGARVYVRGEIACADRASQTTSTILALSEGAEWLDVSVVRTGDERSLRVTRSSLVPWYDLPATLRETFAPLERSAESARAAAALPLRHSQVIEAAGAADEHAVEAWMVESVRDAEKPLVIRRQELEAFAAAEVPRRLIDIAVVLANPQAFQVEISTPASAPASYGTGVLPSAFSRCDRSLDRTWGRATGWLVERDRYYAGWWPGYSDCFAYGPYSRYYGYGFGYGYGYRYGGSYFGRLPVRIVVVPTGPTPSGGRVVRGRGYSSGGGTSGATAKPRTNDGASRANTSTTSSGSSRASSTTGSSGSSGSGRTAKPRTP